MAVVSHTCWIEEGAPTRHLGSVYPADPFIDDPYRDAGNKYWIFIHIILIGYMLLGLNTVCDVYFTGALNVMVATWAIKADVAGATFMAAGGSAPELFTSLIGACITENDVGFGTIVGSAVFNVLFVIGACGFASSEPIKLTWWPLFRDCTFYIMGLFCLAACAKGEKIFFWEALFLFLLYIVYCIIMYYNEKLERWTDFDFLKARAGKSKIAPEDAQETSAPVADAPGAGETPDEKKDPPPQDELRNAALSAAEESAPAARLEVPEESNERLGSKSTSSSRPSRNLSKGRQITIMAVAAAQKERHSVRMQEAGIAMEDEQEAKKPEMSDGADLEGEEKKIEEEENPYLALITKPDNLKDQILWYLGLPIYFSLYYTLPEPSAPWLFLVTFSLSLVWIALYSFFLVWWVEILGEVFHIPTVVMSFTLLAAGTSIPDAVSSVAVARMGEGDMAVSSSIGSNIFDILVGLPIPWMIKIALIEKLANGRDFHVTILSPYLTFCVFLLLFMVFAVILSIHFLGWVLNRTLGVCMGVLYAIFLAVAITVEVVQPEELKF